MSNESTVIETLRTARRASDMLTRLQEGSLDGIVKRIGEALGSDDWSHGPADIRATFGRVTHVIATNKKGETVRVHVSEDDEKIVLGRVDVHDVAVPSLDIASEMLETARAASIALLEDDDASGPMLRSMVRALDVRGDLNRRINLELDIQGLHRNRWYHDVVSENFTGEIDLPALTQEGEVTSQNVNEALTTLADFLSGELSEAVSSLTKARALSDRRVVEEAASAIVEDVKHAIRALKGANRQDQDEMVRVYETVTAVTGRLVAGTRFLSQLVESELQETEEQR